MKYEKLCSLIRRLRVSRGFTLTKLAAYLDIDQSTLSKIENEKRHISADLLPKIAECFDLDLKLLEKEYYSEVIADIVYPHQDSDELLRMAEKKVKYLKVTKTKQSEILF